MPLLEHTFFSQLQGLRLISRRQAQGRLFGEARGHRTGRSGEFADHRHYIPGDDVRDIDWPAFWRLRKPFVKLSESHEERPVHIVLDATSSMSFGEPSRWDYARRLALALAFVALDSGSSAQFILFGKQPEILIPPLHGLSRFRHLCNRLESVALVGDGRVAESLMLLSHLCSGRGLVLVLSDFLDEQPVGRSLSALASTRHEVVLVHLVTPWEAHPDLDGIYELEDAETSELTAVDSGESSLREYHRRFNQHAEELRKLALRRGMHYLYASTDKNEIVLVRKILSILNA